MNKRLSLSFALSAVLWLVACGVALGFQQTWLAALFIVLFIVEVGIGFILKARLRRAEEAERES